MTTGRLQLHESRFMPEVIKAVQELAQENEAQQARLTAQQVQIDELRTRIEALENA